MRYKALARKLKQAARISDPDSLSLKNDTVIAILKALPSSTDETQVPVVRKDATRKDAVAPSAAAHSAAHKDTTQGNAAEYFAAGNFAELARIIDKAIDQRIYDEIRSANLPDSVSIMPAHTPSRISTATA